MNATHSPTTAPSPAHPASLPEPAEPTRLLPIDLLDPNTWNARHAPTQEDDEALTASIREHGVLENLLVRPRQDGRYQIVFGERRFRCARAAALAAVPATVRELDDHEARILTVTENLHRQDLHFLEEADAIAGLFAEGWTLDMVASKLGRPRSWVARRRNLVNLSPAWSLLAKEPKDWMAGWSSAHFEHIATLAPEAQEDLLATGPYRLKRCTTAGELAQLTRSLTRPLSSFPWDLDDAELDPTAGACSVCPLRSSHCPGLFDDQELDASQPTRRSSRKRSAAGADRCLNPLCADRKAALFVAQTAAKLSSAHPTVLLLNDGWDQPLVDGTVHVNNVEVVTKKTPGAIPAVVASRAALGQVRWILQRNPSRSRSAPDSTSRAAGKRSLAERKTQRDRQRKIVALDLFRRHLAEVPTPALAVSIRAAITFGTYQSHSTAGAFHDPALPLLEPGCPASTVRQRMIEAIPSVLAGAGSPSRHPLAAPDLASPFISDLGAGSPVPHADNLASAAAAGAIDESVETGEVDPDEDALEDEGPGWGGFPAADTFWRTFDALAAHDALYPDLLWARTLPVLLSRMIPLPQARDVAPQWNEARHVADLLALDLEAFFRQAVERLPDPKSWATEEAALAKAQALTMAQASTKTPEPPPPAPREARKGHPRKRKAQAPPVMQTGEAPAPSTPPAAA